MIEQIRSLEVLIAKAKMDFEEYITDRTKPLSERWEAFVVAPDFLKNKENYLQHYEYKGRGDVLKDFEYRCQTNHLVDIVENIQYYEDYDDKGRPDSEELVKFKEWILSKNLGSYNCDW